MAVQDIELQRELAERAFRELQVDLRIRQRKGLDLLGTGRLAGGL